MLFQLSSGQSSDLPAIAHLLVETWQRSYADFLPANMLAGLNVDKQLQRHQNYWERGIPYVVAKSESGQLIGFASSGPSRDERFQAERELYTLYVSLDHQRQGIGQALLKEVEAHYDNQGKPIGVSVLQKNPYQAFYFRNGFEQVGEEILDFGEFQEVGWLLRKEID